MTRSIARLSLAGSGAILGLIGGALMFAPKIFLEMSQVFINEDPGLMSELTAPSGILLVTSALMILGAVKVRFTDLGLVVGAVVYGSYGLGRLIAMALHGAPSQSLIAATVVELGVAGVLVILRMTEARRQRWTMFDAFFGEMVV